MTLLGDTVLRASGSGYRGVAFDGNATIDGGHDLSINADSTASINLAKAVGSSAPLRSLNLASAAAVEALESLTIDGTGGSGPGLRFGFAVDNINMTAAGSSISNAAQDGILFAGASTDSTLATSPSLIVVATASPWRVEIMQIQRFVMSWSRRVVRLRSQ